MYFGWGNTRYHNSLGISSQ